MLPDTTFFIEIYEWAPWTWCFGMPVFELVSVLSCLLLSKTWQRVNVRAEDTSETMLSLPYSREEERKTQVHRRVKVTEQTRNARRMNLIIIVVHYLARRPIGVLRLFPKSDGRHSSKV
jgi:hypothetical protein